MWVRSQDYKRLVNVNEFGIEKEKTRTYTFFPSDYIYHIISNDIMLGTYTTEEKALEVLDIIEDCIVGNINCVFQMPQDEELDK